MQACSGALSCMGADACALLRVILVVRIYVSEYDSSISGAMYCLLAQMHVNVRLLS